MKLYYYFLFGNGFIFHILNEIMFQSWTEFLVALSTFLNEKLLIYVQIIKTIFNQLN